jgi:probable HAF family extracellular repeat protein
VPNKATEVRGDATDKAGGSSAAGTAINTTGVIVGYSDTGAAVHAFIYSGSKMQDLHSLIPSHSGWVLSQANGVNDSGEIVGYGNDQWLGTQ